MAVLFSDDVRTESGRAFGREFHARIPDARVIYVDPRIAAGMSDEVLKAVDEAQTVVAAVYVIPTAGKIGNSVAMADATGALLQQVLDHAAAKTAVVAMGNPYLASDFPKIENYMCTFSNATVSEVAAVKALFGEIPIRGHLPVTIPNVAQRGAGAGASGAGGQGEDLRMRRNEFSQVSVCALASRQLLLLLPACSVNVKKEKNGEDKQVDINTPVGGIHVSKGADAQDVGIAGVSRRAIERERFGRQRQERQREHLRLRLRVESCGARVRDRTMPPAKWSPTTKIS